MQAFCLAGFLWSCFSRKRGGGSTLPTTTAFITAGGSEVQDPVVSAHTLWGGNLITVSGMKESSSSLLTFFGNSPAWNVIQRLLQS